MNSSLPFISFFPLISLLLLGAGFLFALSFRRFRQYRAWWLLLARTIAISLFVSLLITAGLRVNVAFRAYQMGRSLGNNPNPALSHTLTTTTVTCSPIYLIKGQTVGPMLITYSMPLSYMIIIPLLLTPTLTGYLLFFLARAKIPPHLQRGFTIDPVHH